MRVFSGFFVFLTVLFCTLSKTNHFFLQVKAIKNKMAIFNGSRFFYNYRHLTNALQIHNELKRLGNTDSQIINFLGDDPQCDCRNKYPGRIYRDTDHQTDFFGTNVRMNHRSGGVNMRAFFSLLTGRVPPYMALNKRLLSDNETNILLFLTGHSGRHFYKFKHWEEVRDTDFMYILRHMHIMKKYKKLLFMSDTCYAILLSRMVDVPGMLTFAGSELGPSFSHHTDYDIGVSLTDRFSYYTTLAMHNLHSTSKATLTSFNRMLEHHSILSDTVLESSDDELTADNTPIMDFFAPAHIVTIDSVLICISPEDNMISEPSTEILKLQNEFIPGNYCEKLKKKEIDINNQKYAKNSFYVKRYNPRARLNLLCTQPTDSALLSEPKLFEIIIEKTKIIRSFFNVVFGPILHFIFPFIIIFSLFISSYIIELSNMK